LIDPHATQPQSVITIVIPGTDCEGFSIVGEGDRIPKLITDPFPDDVMADLLSTAGVDVIVTNLQGEDSHVSRLIIIHPISSRADGDSIPIRREIHRPPK
jgi:hypothetical protein